MTLTERIAARLCKVEGCKRERTHPDQPTCAAHRLAWAPAWRKGLTARDETWRDAA